jgi:hypothetical protein
MASRHSDYPLRQRHDARSFGLVLRIRRGQGRYRGSTGPADCIAKESNDCGWSALVMEKVSLSINLVNAVLQYLGTQPYQNVFQLVDALQKEAKDQPEQKATELLN